jgi:ketosteroid isomerase-like protein
MAKSDDTPIVWGPPVEPPGSVVVTSAQTDLTSAALHGQDHADGLATDGPGVEMLEGEKNEAALVAVLPDGLAVTLQQWSNAWRRQDMPAYLDMYSSDFVSSGGLSRPAWARSRTQRIMEKSNIRHEMRDLAIQVSGSTAVVTFTQIYQDDKVKMTDQKTMHWVYRDGLWLIALEKTG